MALCPICKKRNAFTEFCVNDFHLCPVCLKLSPEQIQAAMEYEYNHPVEKLQRLQKGNSIIAFPDEYVCVDVETTGLKPEEDEIIEVAAVHVKDGEICGKFSSLIKPSRSHANFTFLMPRLLGYRSFKEVPDEVYDEFYSKYLLPPNIKELTGITDDMLWDAPSIDAVMPGFFDFVGDHMLVAHNADFDTDFLYDACQRCGLVLQNSYVDTMRIARKLLPQLEHHRLSDLMEHFSIIQETAHRAEPDVLATIECLKKMKQLVLETQTIPDFVSKATRTSASSIHKMREQKHFRVSDIIRPDVVDPTHPLCGKAIVFTGNLSMSRENAAQMAADVGAIVRKDVSRKTDFLVVGRQDAATVDSSGMSGSEKKAKAFNDSGKGNIQILSEQEFIELLGQKTEAGAI